jgi:His/Glu/Gln/Arg/opine family amino acid ABC transporter permease subunit
MTDSGKQLSATSFIPAFLRDLRVLQALGQIIFVILVVAVLSQVVSSILASLAAKNLTPNLAFLNARAGFDIADPPSWYSSNSSYGTAFLVGLVNTVRVVVLGLFLTTILGVLVGIFLLSSNWLIRAIARVYVELLRNTPLLLQLFAWYFIFMLSLPEFRQPITIPNESVTFIPLRLIFYVIIYLLVRWWQQRSPHRGSILTGLLAAFVAVELGYRFVVTGDPSSGSFWLYVAVSVLLIGATWFAPLNVGRGHLLGLAIGQLIGGLTFVFSVLPPAAFRLEVRPFALISVRGFVLPEFAPTQHFGEWLAFVGVGVALAILLWLHFGRVTEETGRQYPRATYATAAIVGFAFLGWIFTQFEPLPETIPVMQEQDGAEALTLVTLEEARANGLLSKTQEQFYTSGPLWASLPQQRINRAGIVTGLVHGSEISPEYMALLLGLVVYTSTFIAEIVRAGILAVPKGQLEAARALGLSTLQMLSLIILPQALRVIIPPLGNQYLNLSKNSSLAVAIAYTDLVFVTNTIMNQSGQSVTGITLLMIVYLSMSLLISLFTNLANRRFQLVTR